MEWIVNGKAMRVTAKDLQEDILKIREEMKKTEIGSEKYTCLQEQLEKEYVILKKYKETRMGIAPKDALVILMLGGVGFFMIALERENPKAIKLAEFVLRLFPLHL